MSISTNVMPCCFFGARGADQTRTSSSPRRAWVVQILLPVQIEIVAVRCRGHRQRGQVRAGLGFGIALAEEDLAGQDAWQEEVLLRVGAEAMIACATIRMPIGDSDGAPASWTRG